MTWDGVRGTLQWCVLLILAAVIAAGVLVTRWWGEKDRLLADAVQSQVSQILPDCEVEFETVRLVDMSHLELTRLELRKRSTGSPLLNVPRVLVELDPEMLRSHRRIVLRQLMAQSPDMSLIRTPDDVWNWAGLRIVLPPSSSSPEWIIRNGTIRIGFQSDPQGPVRSMLCQGIQASLLPQSHRRYDVRGQGIAEAAGPVQVTGLVDGETGEWRIAGSAGDIRLGDPLLDLIGRLVPQVQTQIVQLRQKNQAFLAQSLMRPPVRTASAGGGPLAQPGIVGQAETASLMRADLALQFEAGRSRAGAAIAYAVQGSIRNGQVSDLLLPVPLYDLAGEFRVTPDKVQVRDLKAANGSSTLYVDGIAERGAGDWAKNFQIRATHLELDERIRSFLWGTLATYFDLLRPAGTFDIDVGITQQPGLPPQYTIHKFEAVDCRVVCDYFRFPVEHIHGQVTQDGEAFDVDMHGEAAGRPVTLSGRIDEQNAQRDIDLWVHVTDFPVDGALRNALQRPEQEAIRKTLESLRLEGVAQNVRLNIVRGTVTDGKVQVCIHGDFSGGTLSYSGFPYEVTDLKGRLIYDPPTKDTCLFENIECRHGGARITGRGLFDMENDTQELVLELSALQIPLDDDLKRATTTATPELNTVWQDFGIKGRIDVDRLGVRWQPDTDCLVTMDGLRWSDGEFRPTAFPYAWSNVSGTMQWDGRRLRIHSLHGDHNGTYLMISGAVPDSAYVDITPSRDVAWRFHVDDLHVIKLNPDEEFKRAAPAAITQVLNAIDLRRPVDLSFGLDLKGWASSPDLITASWWSALVALQDNSLSAGVPVSQMTGRVKIYRGSWDGQNVLMEGYAELQRARALNMPFENVTGPFLVTQNRLTIGQPRLAGKPPSYDPNNPYRQSSLKAGLYGGQVTLDADISLASGVESPPYQLEVSAYNVELAEWARENSMDSQRLMGKVNGLLQATGQGTAALATTGQGWIQITPAALYELPVFAQMMTILSGRPAQPGDAAFTYAYADFTIHDGLFDFTKIQLVGDALSLVGRGHVAYAGPRVSTLELDFYSMASNRIPFLGNMPLMRAVSDRWIRVQVSGTTSQPRAMMQPRIPLLDQAFGDVMQNLEAGPPRRQPPRPVRPPAAASATP